MKLFREATEKGAVFSQCLQEEPKWTLLKKRKGEIPFLQCLSSIGYLSREKDLLQCNGNAAMLTFFRVEYGRPKEVGDKTSAFRRVKEASTYGFIRSKS
ncbi:hypothetical protein SAY87_005421 [Trapa incisa]|uniref:Uncharacterized protein n=1 Tax=Trapa incisa TaxID=236973 RepID=A0AAN7K2W2_9MYRT|nr:hypothetical protein SAY87_005421 [Trapa incisa]